MKTVQKLVDASGTMKAGNHQVIPVSDRSRIGRDFKYYATVICSVSDSSRKFVIDASYGSQSTTRACNAYRKHFAGIGYTEVFE